MYSTNELFQGISQRFGPRAHLTVERQAHFPLLYRSTDYKDFLFEI